MSRLDWKHSSRFDVRMETDRIEDGLRGFVASELHEQIDYWKFNFQTSQTGDVYNENFGVGRQYHPVVSLPCYHVTHVRGGVEGGKDSGFYYKDSIYVVTSFQLFSRTGMRESDIQHQRYLKDILYYDKALFKIDNINVTGQISRYGGRTMVSLQGTQVKPDEMSYDTILAQYANQGSPAPWEK